MRCVYLLICWSRSSFLSHWCDSRLSNEETHCIVWWLNHFILSQTAVLHRSRIPGQTFLPFDSLSRQQQGIYIKINRLLLFATKRKIFPFILGWIVNPTIQNFCRDPDPAKANITRLKYILTGIWRFYSHDINFLSIRKAVDLLGPATRKVYQKQKDASELNFVWIHLGQITLPSFCRAWLVRACSPYT